MSDSDSDIDEHSASSGEDDQSEGEIESSENCGDEDKAPPPKKKKIQSNDAVQGQTLFVRNLPFSVEESELETFFTNFGDIVYCKIVMDQRTGHSRGMAFVKFVHKEDADTVLLDAAKPEKEEEFSLVGRRLNISMAVTRNEAKDLTTKEKVKKDKSQSRNLHLAKVGMIRPGTAEAGGLTPIDLSKREQLMQAKRLKLKDPSIFVSPLRLCVRNIPISVTEKQLLKTFKECGGPGSQITECRIMRDLNRVSSEGQGRSRGFAFVAFDDHQNALAALLKTNNNPSLFGDKKRLIVEFSLENSRALEVKKRREIKSKAWRKGGNQNDTVGQSSSSNQKWMKTDVVSSLQSAKPGPLPKHFGAKNRQRDKALKAKLHKKPKGKLTRKQRREQRKHVNC